MQTTNTTRRIDYFSDKKALTQMRKFSLEQLQGEIGQYKKFTIIHDDPLMPVSLSLQFDTVGVSAVSCRFIALKSGANEFCISHIDRVQKGVDSAGVTVFLLWCKNYTSGQTPATTKLYLCCE